MTLVDLRGREADVPLLPDGPGTPLGWEEDGGITAVARVVRTSPDEVWIRVLAGPAAATLVEAIESVATARRLVGADGVARELDARPAPPEQTAAFTLAALEEAVRASWARDTSDDPDDWSPENPAAGQCGVTSLVIRELLGGEILVANVLLDGRRVDRHAWNRLPSGLALDLTRSQFRGGETLDAPVAGGPMLPEDGRAALLAERVRARLAQISTT